MQDFKEEAREHLENFENNLGLMQKASAGVLKESFEKALKVLQEPAQDTTEFSLQLSRERMAKEKKGWLSRLFGG